MGDTSSYVESALLMTRVGFFSVDHGGGIVPIRTLLNGS